MMVLSALLVVVLVGSFVWWSKSRGAVGYARPQPGGPDVLPPELARWTAAGIISRAQADAIVDYEGDRVPARKIPLFAEALGYIGAVLALAGGGAAIEQVWEDLTDAAHVGLVVSAGGAAAVAGWLLRAQSEPAMQRMMSVLWALSAAAITGASALFFVEIVELTEDALALAIGACGALYALILWRVHPEVLQQVAVFATGLAAAIGVVVVAPGNVEGWAYALVVWVYGAAWLSLGWFELAAPAWSALAFGAVIGSFGPSIMADEHGWQLGLGLATGAALMTLSITGHRLPLLGVGAIASFAYLTALVVRYFGDALGIPMALAIVGILVIGLAVVIGRSGVFGGTGWRRHSLHPAA